MTRSTPPAEWLEQQISIYFDKMLPLIHDTHRASLARHLHGNWLQVESLEVEMLVRAAQGVKIVSGGIEGLKALTNALAPFEKKP